MDYFIKKSDYIQTLKEFAVRFKKEGSIVELMRIQSELASIATGFRVLSSHVQDGFSEEEVQISECALNALKVIETEEYHAGVITLKEPTDFGESIVEVLYSTHMS